MSEEALVDSQEALGADSLEQTIEDTLVQVTGLVVHASHNSIYKVNVLAAASPLNLRFRHTRRMHEAAHNKARCRTASQVQSRAFLHTQVPSQAALGKEVCGELDGTAKAGTDHSGPNATVNTLDTLTSIDLAQAIERVLIVVLGTDREKWRIGLQAGLHQEERRSGSRTDNSGCRTSKDICTQGLHLWIAVNGICDVGANGFVKAETAAVQKDLVDVLDRICALAQIQASIIAVIRVSLNSRQIQCHGTILGGLRFGG